jgi:hypothetical protein
VEDGEFTLNQPDFIMPLPVIRQRIPAREEETSQMITAYEELAQEALDRWNVSPERLQRALVIVKGKTNIYNRNCAPGEFDVRSQTALNAWYHVNTKTHTCTCKDSQKGNACKHRLAVWMYTQQISRNLAEVSHGTRTPVTIMQELGYS